MTEDDLTTVRGVDDVAPELRAYYFEGYLRGHVTGRWARLEDGFDHEVGPPAPLSGEMGGESIPEIFDLGVHDRWPGDDVLDAYEQGYYHGWDDATDPEVDG